MWPGSRGSTSSVCTFTMPSVRCDRPAIFRGFLIIGWIRPSTFCPPFWGRERWCTRRPSGVRSAAISAASHRFSIARRSRIRQRTAAILAHLQKDYGVNAVQFYDNNFFLREDHARELAERMKPLGMRWWCEARVDIMDGFSDETLRMLRESGLVMVFFGVESGNDAVLKRMKKELESAQILSFAKRIREVRHHSGVLVHLRRSAECRAGYARDHRVHPQGEADQSGYGDHCSDVRADAAAERDVRRGGRADQISLPHRTSGPATSGSSTPCGPIRSLPWLPRARQAADPRFRDRGAFALADGAGHAVAFVGAGHAAVD